MKTSRILANLKIIPVYTCHLCQRVCDGTTQSLEVDVCNTQELCQSIDEQQLRASYMPYGWSSYLGRHSTEFRCDVCTS